MLLVGTPKVIPDIVEEHFEELSFLSHLRDLLIFSPDWRLSNLAEHEERLEAHLDGLRLAPHEAAALAVPALEGGSAPDAAAAASTLLSIESPDHDRAVLDAFEVGNPPILEGIRKGLRHTSIDRIGDRLLQIASQGALEVRLASLDVLSFHRRKAPQAAAALYRRLDPLREGLYCAVLGRMGGPWGLDELERAFSEGDPGWQRAALETSSRIGLPGLVDLCRKEAFNRHRPIPSALEYLGALGSRQDREGLERALDDPRTSVAALRGIGALGDIRSIPVLLRALENADLAEEAGRAFIRITGATNMRQARPSEPEAGAATAATEEDPGPRFDAAKMRDWWDAVRKRFDEKPRWQNGSPVRADTPEGPRGALSLEARRDLYLAVRTARPTQTPDVELEARAAVQVGWSW